MPANISRHDLQSVSWLPGVPGALHAGGHHCWIQDLSVPRQTHQCFQRINVGAAAR